MLHFAQDVLLHAFWREMHRVRTLYIFEQEWLVVYSFLVVKKRTKTGQKKHDNGVLGAAQWYESHGYNVQADLPSMKKPKKIGGYIPDLIAKKNGEEIILEVETKKTAKSDQEQQQAFQDYANRSAKRRFKKKIV